MFLDTSSSLAVTTQPFGRPSNTNVSLIKHHPSQAFTGEVSEWQASLLSLSMHLRSLGTAYASPFRPSAPRSAFKRPVLSAGMSISCGTEEGGGKKQEGVENYQSHFVYPMTKKPVLRVQFVHIKGFIMQLTRWSMSGQIRDRQHFQFSWIPSFKLDSSQPSPIRLQVSCSSARNRVMPGCYSPHVVSRHPFQALIKSHPPNPGTVRYT